MIDDNLFEFEGYLSALSNADLWFWVFFRVNDTRINSTKYHKIHPLFMSVYRISENTSENTEAKGSTPRFFLLHPDCLKGNFSVFSESIFLFYNASISQHSKVFDRVYKVHKKSPATNGRLFLKLWTFDVSIQEHRQYTELFRKFKKIHTSSHFLHEYTSKNTIKKYDHIPLTQDTSRGILWNFREDKVFFEFQKYHSLDQSLQRRHEYSREIST